MTEITEKESELLTECRIRRFTTEEALAYLEKNGITISDRTYRRHKKAVENKIEERISQEADVGRVQQLVFGLDTLKKVEKESWNLFSSTQNDVLKERLLKSIDKLQDRFSGYYKDVAFRARVVRDTRKQEQEQLELEQRRIDSVAI